MSDTEDAKITPDEATKPGPDSRDPGYLAWKEAKIRAALQRANEKPDEGLTEEEIWKKFGLDY